MSRSYNFSLYGFWFALMALVLMPASHTIAANSQFHYTGSDEDGVIVKVQLTIEGVPQIGETKTYWFPKCCTINVPIPKGYTDVELPSDTDPNEWNPDPVCHHIWSRMSLAAFIDGGSKDWQPIETFLSGTGEDMILFPWVEVTGMYTYYGVDVAAFYAGGGVPEGAGLPFEIVNGVCADLPGYIFGTSPVYYDSSVGWKTDNLLMSASAIQIGQTGICSEPSTLVLLALGGGVLICLRRSRCFFALRGAKQERQTMK